MDGVALKAPITHSTTIDIKSHIQRIWANHSTSSATLDLLLSIGMSESGLKNVEGITGDMGILQFSPETWEDVCFGNPYNIEDNIKCGIKELEEKRLWRWSASREDRGNYKGWFNRLKQSTRDYIDELNIKCDCMKGLRYLGVPYYGKAKDLPIWSMPVVGSVAKFYYKSLGTYHGGLVTKIVEKGFYVHDFNYEECEETKHRFVAWGSESTLGFGVIK